MAKSQHSVSYSPETQKLLERWKEGIKTGVIPQGVFNNKEIFELEMEHIFDSTWQFVGFEDEILDPGDYVLRGIGSDKYIITRDEEGEVRIFLNSCSHQGTPVCNASKGNTSHFRCRYHGWTFDNSGELVGVPKQDSAYGGSETVKRFDTDLLEIPNDTYNGIIFACPDPDTDETLDDFLGDYKWTLDFFTAPEYEVLGPQRHVGNVNWKIGAFNGMSDGYHVATTHRSILELNVYGNEETVPGSKNETYYTVHNGPGAIKYSADGSPLVYPEEIMESYREALSEEQWELFDGRGLSPLAGGIFPHVTTTFGIRAIEEGVALPVKQFHMWRPIGPNKSEQLYWNVVEKSASEEFKENVRKAQSFMLGTAGITIADDQETQSKITTGSRGTNARRKDFRIDMRMDIEDYRVNDLPIPGDVFEVSLNEENYRYILGKVVDSITGGDH